MSEQIHAIDQVMFRAALEEGTHRYGRALKKLTE